MHNTCLQYMGGGGIVIYGGRSLYALMLLVTLDYWIMNYELWIMDYALWIVDYGLCTDNPQKVRAWRGTIQRPGPGPGVHYYSFSYYPPSRLVNNYI